MPHTVQPNGLMVRRLRIERGWTQEALTEEVMEVTGVRLSKRTVENVEGSKRIYISTLLAVAETLGVPVKDLLRLDLPPLLNGQAGNGQGSGTEKLAGDDTSAERAPGQADTAAIEITINEDFDSFTQEQQDSLLRAIQLLLKSKCEIRLLNKRRGSVVLTLGLSPEQAQNLLHAIKTGELAAFKIIDARLVAVPSPLLPATDQHVTCPAPSERRREEPSFAAFSYSKPTVMKDSRNSSDRPSELRDATSYSLLRLVQAGAPEGWVRLDRMYRKVVEGHCLRLGVRLQDTDDVTQAVFDTVAEKIADFKPQRVGGFRAWLKEITRYKVLDHARKQQGKPQAAGGSEALELMNQLAASADVSTVEEPGERHWVYRMSLEEIREEYCRRFGQKSWDAFWQVVVEQRAPRDVAADLGLTVNAVYIAKSRGLRRLRDLLSGLGEVE